MSYTITHNHTVGDFIQFMHQNKVTEGKIEEVQIFVNKSTKTSELAVNPIWTKIQYSVSYKNEDNDTDTKTVYEEDAFATKQELLDSL